MPRWLAVILTLVLFAAMMLAVRAVLVAVLPGVNVWMDGAFGEVGAFFVVMSIGAACAIYGFWPRDQFGRMRPPLPRRR